MCLSPFFSSSLVIKEAVLVLGASDSQFLPLPHYGSGSETEHLKLRTADLEPLLVVFSKYLWKTPGSPYVCYFPRYAGI